MSQGKTVSFQIGGGFLFSGLTLLFIALKLLQITEVATWSWWWVLGPIWMPLAAAIGIIGALFIGALVLAIIAAIVGE